MTSENTAPVSEREWEDWTKLRFRLGGFATGDYLGKCVACGKHFIGDKRAINCLPCTLTALQWAQDDLTWAARQIAALQGSEGGHAGKLESAPTGGASDLLDGERASIEADARRFEYLLDHHSYHYGMSIAEPSPAEWGIQWQFQQTKPGEQYLSIRDLIDRDIEWRAAQDREDDEPTEAMQAAIKMHGELTASGDGASPYASTTASADTPHEQNTPSTPPDTPEAIGDEVELACEAYAGAEWRGFSESFRAAVRRRMTEAVSALHQAGKLPATGGER